MVAPTRIETIDTEVDAIRFLIWRLRVSLIASTKYGWQLGRWGFCDDDFDRVGFDDGMTPDDYFVEAWGRE